MNFFHHFIMFLKRFKSIWKDSITSVIQYDIENMESRCVYNIFNPIDYFMIKPSEIFINRKYIYGVTKGFDNHLLTRDMISLDDIKEKSTDYIYAVFANKPDNDISDFLNSYCHSLSLFCIYEILAIMYMQNVIDISPIKTLKEEKMINLSVLSINGSEEKEYKASDKCIIQV